MILAAKDFIKLTDTDASEEIIEKKLLSIESFIRKYTNNNFQLRNIRAVSEVKNGKVMRLHKNVSVGDTVQITASDFNNGVYTVDSIEAEGVTLSGKLYDCENNIITGVYYPPDIIMGAVNMLKWDMEKRDKIGIQSEKISRHSVTYTDINENSILGYPKILLGFLKPYMKGRF